jgi:hypothetical protein
MGTDPLHERRSAASMMVRWGLEQCNNEGVVGYLESTLNAVPFYTKMGFTSQERISLRYFNSWRNEYEVYEEIAFVHHPKSLTVSQKV